ncbi:unnamed protein product, partial [Nesidiocoris tenuis]
MKIWRKIINMRSAPTPYPNRNLMDRECRSWKCPQAEIARPHSRWLEIENIMIEMGEKTQTGLVIIDSTITD